MFQFFSIDNYCKQSQTKFVESQNPTQKYLISDQDGTRGLTEAMRLIDIKKFTKIHICSLCQKKFQSLTALTTHSKKQHNVTPNFNGEQRKRGRPKRDAPRPNDHITYWRQDYQQRQQEALRTVKLSSLSTLSPAQMSCMKGMDVHIIKQLRDEKDSISKLQEILQPVAFEVEIMEIMDGFTNCFEDEKEKSNFFLHDEQIVTQMLGALLVNIGAWGSDQFIRLMIIFVKALLSYIGTRGKDDLYKSIKPEHYGLLPQEKNQVFYYNMPVSLFPLLSNGFIAYLPTYAPGFDVKFALLLMKDICDWLYREIRGFVVAIDH